MVNESSCMRGGRVYWHAMKRAIAFFLLLSSSVLAADPPSDAPPTIEPTGPVRVVKYIKPFAVAQPSQATRDYAARYTYGTPYYYYYGYPCGYYGNYGFGWYGWRGFYYFNGPYYP